MSARHRPADTLPRTITMPLLLLLEVPKQHGTRNIAYAGEVADTDSKYDEIW